MTADGPMPPAPAQHRIVDPRGRAKAFRPLPLPEREAALARGLDAYARGAFYLAHEELEPAWMAADDPAERELLAGLIKLAAAGVHAARGNPAGVATNLRGSQERLARAQAAGVDAGLDLPALLRDVDAFLADAATIAPAGAARDRLPDPPPHDVAGPPARSWRPPLGLQPPAIHMRSRA
jgi:predicted metal-dependent hydrolase